MSVRFWEPGKEFQRIETEMMDTMRDVLTKGDLIMRQQMLDFEHHLADFGRRAHGRQRYLHIPTCSTASGRALDRTLSDHEGEDRRTSVPSP